MADEQSCDGCGRSQLATEDYDGLHYCAPCAERRADDPSIEVQGRQLLTSEAVAQGLIETEADDADAKPARRHR